MRSKGPRVIACRIRVLRKNSGVVKPLVLLDHYIQLFTKLASSFPNARVEKDRCISHLCSYLLFPIQGKHLQNFGLKRAKMKLSTLPSPSSLMALVTTFAIFSVDMAARTQAHPVDACAATTDETRTLMDSLFSEFALDNFGESFAKALGDDLVWTVTGSSPIAGK